MSLELIDSKKESKIISKPYLYALNADKAGIYFVEITARAKNHGQNHSFYKQSDDELSVQIDELKDFTKEKSAKWNGNELKNLKKTAVFITYLEKGIYNWNFIPKNKPYLQEINIYKAEDEKVTFTPTINNPSQDGDRRPWYSFILVNIGLNKLTVQAKAKKQLFSFDDDDLKLLIDNEPAKNESKKSHEDWFWCGKILKGKSKEFSREFDSTSLPKSIEFYSDRTPLIEEIGFEFQKSTKPFPPAKRFPTKDDPIWTGDFNDDSEIILLARLIFGEARGEPDEARIWIAGAVLNRVQAKAWPDTIRQVILQPKQYDPFKATDKNYPIIIDPLKNANEETIKIWYRCYEIAEEIITGTLTNPTEATHFHGKGTSREEFERKIVPNGRFLKKIGNTYFYWSSN